MSDHFPYDFGWIFLVGRDVVDGNILVFSPNEEYFGLSVSTEGELGIVQAGWMISRVSERQCLAYEILVVY